MNARSADTAVSCIRSRSGSGVGRIHTDRASDIGRREYDGIGIVP
jgi:hypothetical protein